MERIAAKLENSIVARVAMQTVTAMPAISSMMTYLCHGVCLARSNLHCGVPHATMRKFWTNAFAGRALPVDVRNVLCRFPKRFSSATRSSSRLQIFVLMVAYGTTAACLSALIDRACVGLA